MRLLGIFLALAGATLAVPAQTNAPEVRKLSLTECIVIALEHNLDVKIIRFNPQVARFTLNTDYAPYDPTLSVTGGRSFYQQPGGILSQGIQYSAQVFDQNQASASLSGLLPWGLNYSLSGNLADTWGSEPESASGSAGVSSLSQPLLKNFWIDRTRYQIMLDKKNLKSSELAFRNQVMTTMFSVETAYYTLLSDEENVKVQRMALELAERLLAENKKRVEVGALAPLDEKQAESQVATSRANLLGALGTREIDQRALKNLLSDDYSKWQPIFLQPTDALVAVPQQLDLQESWRRGMTLRPDLLQQKIALEQQGYTVRFTKNQLFPELDLTGAYGYNYSAVGGKGLSEVVDSSLDQLRGMDNPYWSIGGRLTVPLANVSARNNYKSAKTTQQQLALQLKQLQQKILIMIENDIMTIRSDFLVVEATHEATLYADAALDAEQKKLENGKSTSFQVLQLQQNLTTARSAEITALRSYNVAVSQLAVDEGTILERRHVGIDLK